MYVHVCIMYLQLFDICSIRIREYNTIHSTHGTRERENTYNVKYMYCSTIEGHLHTNDTCLCLNTSDLPRILGVVVGFYIAFSAVYQIYT